LNEASSKRQKFESSDSAINSDVEEIKKRLAVRLTDCEAKLGSAQAKINALEKVNSQLQQETETLVAELDKVSA
jgi:TolA-binding protein